MIGVIGLLIAIAALVILSYKGLNAFIASLIAAAIVAVTNWLPFWPSITGDYANAMRAFVGSYFLQFGLGAAYGEFMKVSGAAESVAAKLFKLCGTKMAAVAALLVTLILALGGISAFVIVFAIYPIAAPLFRKANISKNYLPGIVLAASVSLCLAFPGNPTLTNALLTQPQYNLGTNAYAAPIMGTIIGLLGLVLGSLYLKIVSGRDVEKGIGYVVSGSDAIEAIEEKSLPPFATSIIPIITVIVMMFILKSMMPALHTILTSLLTAMFLNVLLNYKTLKGKIVKTFVNGFWNSIPATFLTGGVMGFAGVVQIAPAFQYFINFANSLTTTFNPYVSAVFAVNVVAGITGTALGGLQIFANLMLPNYLATGINPAAFHRIMVIACCGLDTLPHCATFILMCSVCGVTPRDSYKHVFVLTVIIPFIMTAVGILLTFAGIV